RLVGGDFYDFWRLPRTTDHRPTTTVERDKQTSRQADKETEIRDRSDVTLSPPHLVTLSGRSSVVGRQSSELGFVIADVSDKGVAAAMFMALSRSLVRAAALDGSSPSVALGRANRWITRDSESGMFVTLFY